MIRNETWWSGRGHGGWSAGIERKSPSLKVIRSQLLLVLITLVSAFRRVIWYQGVGTSKARELHQPACQPFPSVFVLPGDGLWLSFCCFSVSKASSRVARKARALVLSIPGSLPSLWIGSAGLYQLSSFPLCLSRRHTTPYNSQWKMKRQLSQQTKGKSEAHRLPHMKHFERTVQGAPQEKTLLGAISRVLSQLLPAKLIRRDLRCYEGLTCERVWSPTPLRYGSPVFYKNLPVVTAFTTK